MVSFAGEARHRLLPCPAPRSSRAAAPALGLCRVSLRQVLQCWGCCGGLVGTGGWCRLVCALCGL